MKVHLKSALADFKIYKSLLFIHFVFFCLHIIKSWGFEPKVGFCREENSSGNCFSVENGLVEAFGNGKGRGYILSRSVYSDDSQRMGYVLQKDIDKIRHLELIQSLARENEFVSKSDVVQLLHVSEDRAYYLIKKLVDTNILRIVQKGHYAKYQIVN